jgi:hypothetical protein
MEAGQIVLEYIEVIGGLFLSWPIVILIGLLIFRVELGKFVAHLRSGKVGPLEFQAFERLVERGHSSLSTVEQLNIEIARSRIVELEITQTLMPRPEFEKNIERLKGLIAELDRESAKHAPTGVVAKGA